MKLRHPARRLAALALSLLLLLAFLPTAFAGGETVPAGEGQAPRAGDVAQFGNTEYMKVQEAIDAAKTSGGTVRLLQNVAECITISTGSVTLDLSGHTPVSYTHLGRSLMETESPWTTPRVSPDCAEEIRVSASLPT